MNRRPGRLVSTGVRTGHQPGIPLALAAAALTLAAACGGGDGSTRDSSPASGGTASAAGLHTADSPLGTILVDGDGMTVYVFANDAAGTSTCTGGCAANWPPVEAPAPVPSSIPGVSAALGTATRDDGSEQLTVAARPVYTFVGDSAPGQTSGHGRTLDGGLWQAVSADGSPVPAPGASSPPPDPDDGTGGYGY